MIPSRRLRFEATVAFLAALALYAATTHRRVFSAGNDAARWATIESIVDFRTTAIDKSQFAAAVDQVRIDGRIYSNKPPLLAFAGAAVYAPLARVTGWSLAGRGAENVLFAGTLLLVGVPAALLVAGFHRRIRRDEGVPPATAAALTVALAAGTLLWPYSTTLNAHVPAAAALFFAFLAARDGRGVVAGLLTGLAAALDFLPGAGLAPFFAFVAARSGRGGGFRRFAAGFGAASVAMALANLSHHSSILPAKMVPGAIDLSSQAGPSLLGVVLPERATYPLEILFGGHGLFAVSPVLIFGATGLWIACRRTDADRRVWLALALGIALQAAGHALVAGSFGGWAWGFRYLLPIQPLLLFAAPFALGRSPGKARIDDSPRVLPPWRTALFAAATTVSIVFAALGAYHPWPPGYEQEASKHPVAALVTNPIGGNAAAWLAVHAEGSALARWTRARFVSRDPEAARAWFALFFGSKGDFEHLARFRG